MTTNLIGEHVPKGKVRRRKCAFYKGQIWYIQAVLKRFIHDNPDHWFNDSLKEILCDLSWFLELDRREESTDFYRDLKGIVMQYIDYGKENV